MSPVNPDMEDAMLNRAVLLAIATTSALTTSVAADVISDWNEKAVAFLAQRNCRPHRPSARWRWFTSQCSKR